MISGALSGVLRTANALAGGAMGVLDVTRDAASSIVHVGEAMGDGLITVTLSAAAQGIDSFTFPRRKRQWDWFDNPVGTGRDPPRARLRARWSAIQRHATDQEGSS